MFFLKGEAVVSNDYTAPVVGLIMDGNSRWAHAQGRPASFGHKAGGEAFKRAIETAKREGLSALVAYAFSSENWNRPRNEVSFLMGLAERYFNEFADEAVNNDIRIRVVGDHSDTRIPSRLRDAIDRIEGRTMLCGSLDVFIAFNYSWEQDLVHMAQNIARSVELDQLKAADVSTKVALGHLLSKEVPNIDLVIRTSGEQRLSGFFPAQTAYAEFMSLQVHWPDFDEATFIEALKTFRTRERRFGTRPQQKMLVAAE